MHPIQEHVRLAKFSTYQVGGEADFFVEVDSADEVAEAMAWAEERSLPVFVLGGGSNLLFDSAGFRGLVIAMKSGLIEVRGEHIWAEAGVKMAQVVKAAEEAGLAGLEPWCGLPGTVGGAVRGNAGCFGLETSHVLANTRVFFPGEGVQVLGAEDLHYGYRSSLLKERFGVVLDAEFALRTDRAEDVKMRGRDIARLRIQKQPPGLSTGSFFKNPSADQPAGWLIEQCGLKGLQVGGAKISEHHANFLMNAGGATSEDFLELSAQIEAAVFEKFGVKLEREIVFVPAGV